MCWVDNARQIVRVEYGALDETSMIAVQSSRIRVEFARSKRYHPKMFRAANNPRLLPVLLAILVIVSSAPFVDAHGGDQPDHVASGVYVDSNGDAGSSAPSSSKPAGPSHAHFHTCCPHAGMTPLNGISAHRTPVSFRTTRKLGHPPPGFFQLPLRPPTLSI